MARAGLPSRAWVAVGGLPGRAAVVADLAISVPAGVDDLRAGEAVAQGEGRDEADARPPVAPLGAMSLPVFAPVEGLEHLQVLGRAVDDVPDRSGSMAVQEPSPPMARYQAVAAQVDGRAVVLQAAHGQIGIVSVAEEKPA